MNVSWQLRPDGTLQEAGPVDSPRPIVWVPTEQVHFLQVQVPGRRAREWRQALPWAVEDELAEPVEQVHIRPLFRTADGITWCAIVSQDRLTQWQQVLAEAGLETALLVADCFRLPWQDDRWQGIRTDRRVLIRTGPWSGLAASKTHWPTLQTLADTPAQQVHWLPHLPPTISRHDWHALSLVDPRPQPQDPFRRRMRLVGGLLIGLLGLHLATLAWDTHLLNRQTQQLRTQTRALFHQAFPDVKRLVKLRAQVRQRLAQSKTPPADPIALLARLDPLLQRHKVRVKALTWQSNQWHLSLEAASARILEALQRDAGPGARLDIQQIRPNQAQGILHVAPTANTAP